MTQFIESDVRDYFESRSSEPVTLLVGTDGDLNELSSEVVALGGDVHDHVGRTTLKADVPESSIEELCGLPSVISVELNKQDVRTQESEDFRFQAGSMM